MAPNEKVAMEVAFGASLNGARAACTMKHVGLNVAADPLFTMSYTGVTGGLCGLRCGRSRDALLPERTGFTPLRPRGEGPHAGACGLRRGA